MQIRVTQLIMKFKFTIVLRVLLYRVVCKMNVPVIQLIHVELSAWRPYVAFRVVVALVDAVDRGDHGEDADVEFSSVDEQWVGDVLLDDYGVLFKQKLPHCFLPYLRHIIKNCNPSTTIRILSWLYNPGVILILPRSLIRLI